MTTTTKTVGTGANDAGYGSAAWSNPGNITTDDTSYATILSVGATTSNYLVGTMSGNQFSLSSSQIIDGIEVTFWRNNPSGAAVTDDHVIIVKGGVIAGTEKSTGATWGTGGIASVTFGGAADLWGQAWSYSDINASNFGVALSAAFASIAQADVDYIEITVHHHTGSAAIPITAARSRNMRKSMWDVRQSTASQEIPLGQFVDSTDGVTPETALSIANTDIKLFKTGATSFANKNSGGATHISTGNYYAVLDATDTDTIGPMRVYVEVSGALPVWLDCCVLDEAVFDVKYGTTAPSTLGGTAQTGDCFARLTGTGAVTFASFTVSAATTLTGAVSLGSTLGVTGTTTLAAVNTGAIAASTFATSGTTTLNALTVTNATTLSGAVSLGSTLGVTGTTTFAAINTGAIGTGAISATTFATSGTTTLNALTITNALTVSGATTLTGIVTASNASNNIVGVVASLSTSESNVIPNGTGTATAGAATTITLQTALGADTRAVGCRINLNGGTGSGQSRTITGYVNGTKVATVNRPWTTNPDNTTTYAVVYDDSAFETVCRVGSAFTSSAGTEVRCSAWLERNGQIITTYAASASCTFTFREHGSGTDLFTVTDSAVNAQGIFEVTQATPGFTSDRLYIVSAEITEGGNVFTTREPSPVFG